MRKATISQRLQAILDVHPGPELRWPVRVRVNSGQRPHDLLFFATEGEYGSERGGNTHNGHYHGAVHRCVIDLLAGMDVAMDLAGEGDEYYWGKVTRSTDTIACALSTGASWVGEDLDRIGLKTCSLRENSSTIAPCGILTGARGGGAKCLADPPTFTAHSIKYFHCGCEERRDVGSSFALVRLHSANPEDPPLIVQLDAPTPAF
jgi:hypothetical protein